MRKMRKHVTRRPVSGLHQSNMECFFLCNGDETQGNESPTGGAFPAFRGSSECPAQGNLKYSFGQFPTMIQLLFQHPIPYKKDFGNSPKVLFLIVTRLLLFLCCVHEVLHTKEVCIIAGYVRFFHVHIVVFIKWYNCPCIH